VLDTKTRERSGEQERQAILAALVEVVAERGYSETTVGMVLAHAGLGRVAFDRHFRDKHDCFLAAWQEQNETKSPDSLVGLARLYLRQNQPENALPYLLQAVAAFPELSLAHEELGKAFSVLRRLHEAQEQLEKAVQLSPQKAPLRCLLGQVYQQEKMTAKAQSEFERCTALRTAESQPAGVNQTH